MSKQANVFVFGICAGVLEESSDGSYIFEYNRNYLSSENPKPVSLTLPLSNNRYESQTLFPFFDGLIPEGWLLNITTKNWKIDSRDRMELLLKACGDCIGAVHVEPYSDGGIKS
jgi:serine/threonine-protein kinase HipA